MMIMSYQHHHHHHCRYRSWIKERSVKAEKNDSFTLLLSILRFYHQLILEDCESYIYIYIYGNM